MIVKPPRFFCAVALRSAVASASAATVAQLGDLLSVIGGAPSGSHVWPGNIGLNTYAGGLNSPNAIGLADTVGTGTWRVSWLQAGDWKTAS